MTRREKTDALDCLEAILDVCDLDNPGPMYAGQNVRSAIARIDVETAATLRALIADDRAALKKEEKKK